MMRFSLLLACCLSVAAQVPTGFTPIFNGKNLSGWHVSEVNHHGNTKAWTIRDGILSVTQDPLGNGGILLTDKKYREAYSRQDAPGINFTLGAEMRF